MKRPVLFLPILAFVLSLVAIGAPASTRAAVDFPPISETFMDNGATSRGWLLDGDATLTSGKDDPTGQGWLRLTSNKVDNNVGQAGSAIYNNAFPSSAGIRAEFQYATYGANKSPGADGFSFYLIDGSVGSPTVGAAGAGLGYGRETVLESQNKGGAGVQKGYVGIGFDEFGNFASNIAGSCSPTCQPGFPSASRPTQSVTLRGSGSLNTGFNYLTHTKVSNNIDDVSREAARWVRITLDDKLLITVEIDYGSGYQTVIDKYNLTTATGQAALPATFKLGFSASNFNPANYHEIRNLSVTSAKRSTTTLITSGSSINYGQSVTFTATVTGSGGTRTGTVTFYDGSTVIGTGTLDAAGKATLTTTSLFAGTRTITARYGGDKTFGSSSSTAKVVTVVGITTTTTITTATTTALLGEEVSFTATVTGASGTPKGQVIFLDGTKKIGSATLSVTGTATFKTSSLKSGARSITAQYAGGEAYGSSTSSAVTVTVSASSISKVTITSTSNSSSAGQSVTFTIKVSGSGGTPGGSVTFFDGNTQIGSVALDSKGTTTFTTSSFSSGTHTITARYEGDANFASSSSTATLKVTGTVVTTTTFTATVTNQKATFNLSVSGNGGTPTGNVTFRDGSTVIGTGTLDASGKTTFTSSTLTSGSHTITATYEGDDNFASSTFTLTINVAGSVSTTTTFTAKVVNQTATFSVSVSGSGGTPTGTVTFLEGSTVVGTATLDASGQATFSTSTLSSGSHTITARYDGDATFASSTSTVTVTIGSLKTTTTTATVTISGQTTTFNVSVAGAGGTPTGSLTFFDGSTQIGTATLDANGAATLTTSTLTTGTHGISVIYGGDTVFGGSSAILTLTLNGTTFTSISLASTSGSSISGLGQPITLMATVSGASGTPTGSVTFIEGTTVIGSGILDANGKAVVTTTTLGEGTHTVTARYEGNSTYEPITSPGLMLTVNAPSSTASDLSVSQTYVIAFVRDITFTIVARNNGLNAADGAIVSNPPLPPTLNNSGWTWTCVGSNGATCSASGKGEINDTLTSFPSGGVATYTLRGSLDNWNRWVHTVRIAAPVSISESDVSNNVATLGRYQVLLPQMTRR